MFHADTQCKNEEYQICVLDYGISKDWRHVSSGKKNNHLMCSSDNVSYCTVVMETDLQIEHGYLNTI